MFSNAGMPSCIDILNINVIRKTDDIIVKAPTDINNVLIIATEKLFIVISLLDGSILAKCLETDH